MEVIAFYGHRPAPRGPIGARACLSQWYAAPFEVDGITYPTAEHWLMHQKALAFGDSKSANRVLQSPNPAHAKSVGRAATGYDDAFWSSIRRSVATYGNLAKFTQHPALGRILLSTGDAVLVEASPRDRVWGVGLAFGDPRLSDPEQWRGLNLLGQALMAVRDELRRS